MINLPTDVLSATILFKCADGTTQRYVMGPPGVTVRLDSERSPYYRAYTLTLIASELEVDLDEQPVGTYRGEPGADPYPIKHDLFEQNLADITEIITPLWVQPPESCTHENRTAARTLSGLVVDVYCDDCGEVLQ